MHAPNATSHLRVARPTRNLQLAETFWVRGVGMDVLWRTTEDVEDEYRLLMVGWREAAWHIELVEDEALACATSPSEEDLLVLYLCGPIDDAVVSRILESGGTRVPSRNPYWDEHGVTFADPDGYRLVLTRRSWTD